jgi:hypothetical protein
MSPKIKYQKLHDKDWLETQFTCHMRTRSEVAREIGCSPNTVSNCAKKLGVSVPNYYRERARATKAKLYDPYWLREQYDAGRSTNSICKELGCTAKTVLDAACAVLPTDYIVASHRLTKMRRCGPTAKSDGRTRKPQFAILPSSPLANHPLFEEFVRR